MRAEKSFADDLPITPRAVRALLLAGAVVVWITGTLAACDAGSQDTANGVVAGHIALDAVEVERWADEVFGKLLEEHRVSALAISVTEGNEVVFKKGYGYADWRARTPVDPDVSQFRIGSLTKTFLATAIAQLLERGKIDSLEDPVNKYLTRVRVENPFGGEISIWDMLTHQGGMDHPRGPGSVFSLVGEPRPQPPLTAEVLEANMTPVVREPGTLSVYCNVCSATLGFMVEDITGQTLEGYLKENVYQPLRMTHTTLINSLHAPSPNVVTQYGFAPGEPPVAMSYPSIAPFISYAGDINSTAGDMARFIRAHVMQGEGSGPALMKPETFRLMHTRKRGNHPDASGFGMQFFTYDYNGQPIIEHYGSIRYRSLEIMMLDEKIGVFVTMAGGGEANPEALAEAGPSLQPIVGSVFPEASHSGVRALILEHFLGPLPLPEDMTAYVSRYTGVYHSIPADPNEAPAHHGVLVEDSGDGGLIIDGLGVYRPSGPDAFTLDGQLPVEAGFRESNRYVFIPEPEGAMRMFAHVNAGGYERER